MSALYAVMDQLNNQGQEKVLEYIDDLVASGKYAKEELAILPYAVRKSDEPRTSTGPDTDAEI